MSLKFEKITLWGKRILAITLAVSIVALTFIVSFASYFIDKDMTATVPHEPYYITNKAKSLHKNMVIMDWHSDALLWDRSLLTRNERGHVDLPRLIEGNIAVQMFTTVTKTPTGQNYGVNPADGFDNITALVMAQLWPPKTWNSLLERALYQAKKLKRFAEASDGQLIFIKSKKQLIKVLKARSQGDPIVGAMLGTEGAHPLQGDIHNIDRLYDAGFRMIGLTHFFDNDVGGSLHGVKKGGLTKFGKQAVARMIKKGIIIDLAHASQNVVEDVLAMRGATIVISHTGMKGACGSARNLPDDLMKRIAQKGGLIGIGFWKGAICQANPIGIAKSIIYGIQLVGADHIVLGSDWDGAVTALSADEINVITQTLISAGISYRDITKVMGQNSINFLMRHLPNK